MSVQIITTEDGSHSLFNPELNETYHSVHGAIQESKHVFIKNGLDFFIEQYKPAAEVHILEVGFGTGLNALLTLRRSLSIETKIYYTSLETFPLKAEVWSQLNYGDALAMKDDYLALHDARWETWISVSKNFYLLKLNNKLEVVDLPAAKYDLVYFDAFAPSKQPELWALPLLQKVSESMTWPTTFVTYCAKGQLKRDLKDLDFEVQTLPGPPGKKEMTRAVRG